MSSSAPSLNRGTILGGSVCAGLALALLVFSASLAHADAPAGAKRYTRNVAIVLYEGVELLDFAGPGEVFQAAGGFASCREQRGFNVYTVATSTKPLTSQRFLKVVPEYSIGNAPHPDIIVIPGGGTGVLLGDPNFMPWVAKASSEAEITLTVCTGALVAARSGQLDGLTATTWYGAIDRLREAAPKATVQDGRRFVDNGSIITTAGVSAGIDGALHTVARYMEYHWTPEPYLAQSYNYLNPSLGETGRAMQRAEMLADEKDYAGAAQAYRALIENSADDAYLWYRLGYLLQTGGQLDSAIEAHMRASRFGVPAEIRRNALYNLACAYTLKGRTDDALRSLEGAIAAGFKNRAALLSDPDLNALHSDERFKKLVAAL